MRKTRRGWRIAAGVLIGLLLLAGALGAWLAAYDWNGARGLVARQVEARTGRAFAIEGDLSVRPFSMNPRVRAEQVTFANADWGESRPMLAAGVIAFRVSLPHLLLGRIVLTELELGNADVLLERTAEGHRNWILKPPEDTDEGRSPQIRRLAINDSRIRVRDAASDSEVEAHIQSQPGQETYGLKVTAKGRVRGVPLALAGDSGGLLQLMDEHKPYPIRLQGTLGESRASALGTLTGVATLQDVDVDLTLSGTNMAPLGEVLRISLPHTKPYSLAGRLERRGPVWRFFKTRGKVGESDLGGDFTIDTKGERPLLSADLRSRNLDIADLGGFVGTRPGATEKTRKPGKLLPSEPINLEKLNRMDARVRLVATRFVQADKLPLDNLDATLSLVNGELRLDPLLFGVADGTVRTVVKVDARSRQLKTSLDTSFRKLHINRLIPGTDKLDASFGAVDGRVRLAGAGNSPAAMLAGASGRIQLHSGGGTTSNLLMEFAGADIAEIVKFWVGGDRQVQLRCAVMSFHVDRGIASSEVIVVDTEDTVIGGDGKVNFRDETLDLRLVPLPKDFSILALRGPLYVNGPFLKPEYGLEKKSLARKIGSTLLLGLLNPLAALAPLIETGPGRDAPCAELVATVQAAAAGKRGRRFRHPRERGGSRF